MPSHGNADRALTRVAEAIDLVCGCCGEDGRWALQHAYRGKTYFELERLGRRAAGTRCAHSRVLK